MAPEAAPAEEEEDMTGEEANAGAKNEALENLAAPPPDGDTPNAVKKWHEQRIIGFKTNQDG